MASAVRIGLLTPQEGPAGIWGPSAQACAALAVHELNASRGLLGRGVELVVLNTGTCESSAAEAADFAVAVEEVDAIVGMFPSYARAPVAAAIAERVPFIYTPQFEGRERDRSVVTTGETALELLLPGIEWLARNRRGQRFFLCGSDYVWPRATLATARELVRGVGGTVTGEAFLPFDDHDYEAIFAAIRATRTEVVLPYFLGSDAIAFNRAFAEAGLARRVLRFTSAVDETILYGLDENATENLFVTSAYFSTLRSRNNGAFLERYHGFYGDNPPPANGFGQSCYEGVHCLAALAEAASTLRAAELRRSLGRTRQGRTARGDDAAPVAGARQPIHLARVDGYEFTILATP
jgi:urea transport system substrate-binding protein